MNHLTNDNEEKNPFGLSQVTDNTSDTSSFDSCAEGDSCKVVGDEGGGGGGGEDD